MSEQTAGVKSVLVVVAAADEPAGSDAVAETAVGITG